VSVATETASEAAIEYRRRRHPTMTQFDGLHLRILVRDIAAALAAVPGPVDRVLDVYCGGRPYDDLLPPGTEIVGHDVIDHYGVADVISDEFLPFPDASFDVVLCTEAFHYVADAAAGVAELQRVLRPGGTAIITVPLVWEYDRTTFEHRYTASSLTALFARWDDVDVVENGGRGVAWACLTGRILESAERILPGRVLRPLFRLAYLAVNGAGALIERADRHARNPFTLPMNLLLTARRPA
jgi:SAM-dependent methyltransferase